MKALVYSATGKAGLQDVADPRPAADEVVIEVGATGLCHTDFDILHGRYMASYPVIPGHETAGTVIARGKDVIDIAIGDRVAVDPIMPCGHCAACKAGRPSICQNLRGYGATVDGAFAPLFAAKAGNVHSIGELPFHIGALAEPLACVLHGIDRARVRPGSSAVIFGAGPIGLMMMMGLQAKGVGAVTMVDLEPDRLERARKLGADGALDARGLDPAALPARFDLVVDCTGVPAVFEKMPSYANDGGTLLFFGVCPPTARAAFSPYEIFRRELTLVGSHSLSFNLPDAIDTLRKLGPRADALVSHRMSLEAMTAHILDPHIGGTMKIQYDASA